MLFHMCPKHETVRNNWDASKNLIISSLLNPLACLSIHALNTVILQYKPQYDKDYIEAEELRNIIFQHNCDNTVLSRHVDDIQRTHIDQVMNQKQSYSSNQIHITERPLFQSPIHECHSMNTHWDTWPDNHHTAR
jgi:hypothetical protein